MSRPRRVPFFIFYFLFSENFPVQCEFRPLIPITHRLVRSFIHSLTKKKKTSAGFIHQADVAADEAARRSNQNSAVFFFSFWFKVKIFHWKFDDPLPPPGRTGCAVATPLLATPTTAFDLCRFFPFDDVISLPKTFISCLFLRI